MLNSDAVISAADPPAFSASQAALQRVGALVDGGQAVLYSAFSSDDLVDHRQYVVIHPALVLVCRFQIYLAALSVPSMHVFLASMPLRTIDRCGDPAGIDFPAAPRRPLLSSQRHPATV